MYDPTGHPPGAVPFRVFTALRGETKRLDAPAAPSALSGGAVTIRAIDTATASLGRARAELAQRRAEQVLARLAAITHAGSADAPAYAAGMAETTLAAAQALLSAHVMWRARAEAGGLTVRVTPIVADIAERGA